MVVSAILVILSTTLFALNDARVLNGRQSSSSAPCAIVTFPQVGTAQEINGYISFAQSSDGVHVEVNLDNLPLEVGGLLRYHIHEKAVASDCKSAGKHFDPENVGVAKPCNWLAPSTCQYGDMAGKYDDLRRSNVNIFYVDPFLSLYPESKGYFGGLSVVIHPGDDTRIACGNIIPTSCSDIKICPQT